MNKINIQIKIIARVIAYNRGKILLVKNKGQDYWYPPGGRWEHEKETILEGARREVKEETGLNITIKKLLYLQEFHPKPDLVFFETFWLGKLSSGQFLNKTHVDLDPNGQVQTARWFSKKELENLKVFPKRLKTSFWKLDKNKGEDPFIQ